MEFGLISRIRSRIAARGDVALGIGDDAAVLRVPAGQELVVAMDTLNAGVHFFEDAAAADIGWKSLAVNLSDLAAMGAEPAWCTLSLSLPSPDADWVDGFLDGFLALAAGHGVALVGGDTTRGPLSVCVTAHGLVDAGRALRRDGARVGDEVWVTGTPGDAAAALSALSAGDAPEPALRRRLERPEPRIAAGLALRGLAGACIDVSDGLLADLGHVCTASGVGAVIELERLPVSKALADFPAQVRWPWQAAGGDDYELCFTAAAGRGEAVERALAAAGVAATRIGRIVEGGGVRAVDPAGAPWRPARTGFEHFGD